MVLGGVGWCWELMSPAQNHLLSRMFPMPDCSLQAWQPSLPHAWLEQKSVLPDVTTALMPWSIRTHYSLQEIQRSLVV